MMVTLQDLLQYKARPGDQCALACICFGKCGNCLAQCEEACAGISCCMQLEVTQDRCLQIFSINASG